MSARTFFFIRIKNEKKQKEISPEESGDKEGEARAAPRATALSPRRG